MCPRGAADCRRPGRGRQRQRPLGHRGTLSRSTDGGRTWTAAGLATNPPLTGLVFTDALHGWAVGRGGQDFHTIDGGLSWSAQPDGSDVAPLSIAPSDNATACMLTADGQVLATATAGF